MTSNAVKLFENVMSPQKEVREQAEKDLDQLKTLPVSQSLPVFAEGMSSATENVFQLSTLLFKKTYCDDKEKYRSNYPKRDFIAVEMEAYALFYVARKLKKDAACLLTVVDSLFDSQNLTIEQREKSLNDMIKVALESLLD